MAPSSLHPLGYRSDCLIKTIRSEGYFGMYRGEVLRWASLVGSRDGAAAWASSVSMDISQGTGYTWPELAINPTLSSGGHWMSEGLDLW
jgi:hypothetical protein